MNSSLAEFSGPLVVALLAGCEKNVRRILRSARDTGADLARIALEVIEPALDQIGCMWARCEVSVAEEHLATSLVTRALTFVADPEPERRPAAPRIVLACLSGEFHELGIRIASLVARESGWETEELGANVPRRALQRFVGQRCPQALGISMSLPEHVPECVETVRECREASPSTRILVGGRVLRSDPSLASLVGADVVVPDAVALRAWLLENAGTLRGTSASVMPPELPPMLRRAPRIRGR